MTANHAKSVAVGTATADTGSDIAVGVNGDLAALTLDDRGIVCDCNRAGEALFKYRRSELVWRHISMLLPQLEGVELLQNGQPNPRLRFLCRIGHRFQVVAQDGERFASELFLNRLDNTGHCRLSLIVRPAESLVRDPDVAPTSRKFNVTGY